MRDSVRYAIPEHVSFALERDTVVFIDLRSDQYSMINGESGRAFQSLLSHDGEWINRLIEVKASDRADVSAAHHDVIAELLAAGLLTTAVGGQRSPIPVHIPVPEEDLLDFQSQPATNVSIRDIWIFLISCLIAKLRLVSSSIENTVLSVARRNRASRAENEPLSCLEARRLVATYNCLRRFLPIAPLCLYDSLSLIEFLARHRCFPSWVFAVRLEPWGAHCWVQSGAIAFNQHPEEAQTYLPLLIVQ